MDLVVVCRTNTMCEILHAAICLKIVFMPHTLERMEAVGKLLFGVYQSIYPLRLLVKVYTQANIEVSVLTA